METNDSLKTYMPVPVVEARMLSETYNKEIVVVIAWDKVHNMLHTTTFGVSDLAREKAVNWGERIQRQLGADLTSAVWYETYSGSSEAARNKQDLDKARASLKLIESGLENFTAHADAHVRRWAASTLTRLRNPE